MLFSLGALFSRMLALPLSRVARSPRLMLLVLSTLLLKLLLLLLLLLLLKLMLLLPENLLDC